MNRLCRILHGKLRQPFEWYYFPLLTGRIVLSNKKRNLRKYSVVFFLKHFSKKSIWGILLNCLQTLYWYILEGSRIWIFVKLNSTYTCECFYLQNNKKKASLMHYLIKNKKVFDRPIIKLTDNISDVIS